MLRETVAWSEYSPPLPLSVSSDHIPCPSWQVPQSLEWQQPRQSTRPPSLASPRLPSSTRRAALACGGGGSARRCQHVQEHGFGENSMNLDELTPACFLPIPFHGLESQVSLRLIHDGQRGWPKWWSQQWISASDNSAPTSPPSQFCVRPSSPLASLRVRPSAALQGLCELPRRAAVRTQH